MYPAVPYNLHGIYELHKIRQNEVKKKKKRKNENKTEHSLRGTTVSLVVFFSSVSTYILFLPFSLLALDVNGQTNLIFVLLCNFLCSYVLLIYLIHRLF
jgi:hypothetical protein